MTRAVDRPPSIEVKPIPETDPSAGITAGDVTALWAEQQFTALEVTDPPEYGSPAWIRLRAEDPRRAAAIIEAAEHWRRHVQREHWLDKLLTDDPERWFHVVTQDADGYARTIAASLARRPTNEELAGRRQPVPVREVRATPGWPPIAIPGRPGWWWHCIDGRQVDLPHNRVSGQERTS
ncbi:DUF2742 domain-containing protein [Streptomyces orinoci]|uniref:DUF2742 domain-containing protein n=1 Tax=Streptomyces orinoci TaxID=67339 RepID=A0ABV3JTT4_STRON|nr:DUF2742 domain-containing protein [Streptomyces orinoci]